MKAKHAGQRGVAHGMPTTRSARHHPQTTLEAFQDDGQLVPTRVREQKSQKRLYSTVSPAGKHAGTRTAGRVKRVKTEDTDLQSSMSSAKDDAVSTSTARAKPEFKSNSEKSHPDRIMINRAPVLQLWAACVAQCIHPNLTFDTCLSVGSAISALCAVAKGRAVGVIQPKKESVDEQRKRHKKNEDGDEGGVVEVMHFTVPVQKGVAVIDGKQKKANEEALRRKFGGGEVYNEVQAVMKEAIDSWTGKEDGLNKRAFEMYENFRPVVPQGQRGWGRKGELDLQKTKQVVQAQADT